MSPSRAKPARASDEQLRAARTALRVALGVSLTVGCLLQGAVFFVIFRQIRVNGDGDGELLSDDGGRFEGFDGVAPFYAIDYSLFPLVAGLYAFNAIYFYQAELLYIALGLATKTSLFWLIFGTVRELVESHLRVAPRTADWSSVSLVLGILLPYALLALGVAGVLIDVARSRLSSAPPPLK